MLTRNTATDMSFDIRAQPRPPRTGADKCVSFRDSVVRTKVRVVKIKDAFAQIERNTDFPRRSGVGRVRRRPKDIEDLIVKFELTFKGRGIE